MGKELIRTARALLSKLQLRKEDWAQLITVLQRVMNNAPSPQRGDIAPITAFMSRPDSTPISTFLQPPSLTPTSITQVKMERSINSSKLVSLMDDLHPVVQSNVQGQRKSMREQRSAGKQAHFTEGDFVLLAREQFGEAKQICLRWLGLRRVVKALNDYVFVVEDLRSGTFGEAHGSRLKFYSDNKLDAEVIMSHVLSYETGMSVSRLRKVVEGEDGKLSAVLRWKGLQPADDSLEPLHNVSEDAPRLIKNFLKRRATSPNRRARVKAELGL